jgi:hypothetical protein
MKESDFEDMFENMKKPDVNVNPPKEIKLAILNYRKSALLTVGFVVLPAIFIFGMVMKYEFDVDLGIVLVVAEWIAAFSWYCFKCACDHACVISGSGKINSSHRKAQMVKPVNTAGQPGCCWNNLPLHRG